MSRVIRPESGASLRKRYLRSIAHALRHGAKHPPAPSELRDMAAFIALALEEVQASTQETVRAWEKRGYWIKADRFQQQWRWVATSRRALDQALSGEDIEAVLPALATLAGHVITIKVPKRMANTRPWQRAWDTYKHRHPGA